MNSKKSGFRNAWEYLNSLPQEYQDHVWDDLLDNPVHEIVEHLLRVSDVSLIEETVREYALSLPDGCGLRENVINDLEAIK